MINWTTITNRIDYENQRYNFLLKTEENGTPKLFPYNDNKNLLAAGNITIGVGFNLEGSAAVRDEVFRTFGLIRNNPALSTTPPASGQLSAQQVENNYIDQLVSAISRMTDDNSSELDTIMATRAADDRLAALGTRRSTFAFNDEPEIRATFDRLMTNIYEPKVDSWLSGIPDSRERTALISLAWNQKDSSPLLGNKLKAAVTNGDRAEAWYEIRYNSNSAGQAANIRDGIAKRRYFEADTFGLYNVAAANNDEDAKGAFRTYTRHRAAIDSYDSQFGAQVALANSAYNTTIVQTRQAWFQPARVHLTATYGQGINITGDILVGEHDGTTSGIDTRYFRGSDRDLLQGSDADPAQGNLMAEKNVTGAIFGLAGDDVLDGNGVIGIRLFGDSGDGSTTGNDIIHADAFLTDEYGFLGKAQFELIHGPVPTGPGGETFWGRGQRHFPRVRHISCIMRRVWCPCLGILTAPHAGEHDFEHNDYYRPLGRPLERTFPRHAAPVLGHKHLRDTHGVCASRASAVLGA